jgi:hypothetical protein
MSKLTAEQRKEHNRKYYQNNKEKFRVRDTHYKAILKAYVWDVKLQSKCSSCGESHPAVLDFHHRNPEEKTTTIAMMIVNGYALDKVKEEIEKCDILCANCHRKLHYDKRASLVSMDNTADS